MAHSLNLVDFHANRTLLCERVDSLKICRSYGIPPPLLMHFKTIIDEEDLIERAEPWRPNPHVRFDELYRQVFFDYFPLTLFRCTTNADFVLSFDWTIGGWVDQGINPPPYFIFAFLGDFFALPFGASWAFSITWVFEQILTIRRNVVAPLVTQLDFALRFIQPLISRQPKLKLETFSLLTMIPTRESIPAPTSVEEARTIHFRLIGKIGKLLRKVRSLEFEHMGMRLILGRMQHRLSLLQNDSSDIRSHDSALSLRDSIASV
jgi:hypothetical protein